MSKRKKTIITLILAVIVWLVFKFLTVFYIGDIDYEQTLRTDYIKTEPNIEITKTNWAKLQTTSRIVNISTQPTCPGYVGVFLTSKGMLEYEYGMFLPTFDSGNIEYLNYEIKTDTVNGRFIRTVETLSEFGISMPAQNEMKWNFTIYPSTTGKKLKEELINLYATAEFK